MDLTIDICIIMDAYGLNGATNEFSFNLLEHIKKTDKWVITLDDRKKIKYQYDTKIKSGEALKWLQYVYDKQKYDVIPWKKIPKGVQVKLKEEHFDNNVGEDYKYLITAANSNQKTIITRDPDYSPRIKKIVKKELGVSVVLSNEIVLT